MTSPDEARAAVDAVYRGDSRRVLATLIRLLGDFDLAEEAMHEAFSAALERWPRDGVPGNPRAWLVSAGRFKAIDGIRRRARFDASLGTIAERLDASTVDPADWDDDRLEDDRLRLIFTCCHPALPPDAQIALTLREVCGLTTEEIARAFLTAPPTVAQRIVRAKAKIRAAGIPYQVPARAELPDRLDSVLHVVYLVFNEGYSASAGETLTRVDLSTEAIRLGRLLVELLPEPTEPEAVGLLALMLLHEARRAARTSATGELILLDEQDRSCWDQRADRGRERAGRAGAPLPTVRPVHAPGRDRGGARRGPGRRRDRLGADRGALRRAAPVRSVPVVELNRAAAVAMRDGPAAGLALMDALLARGELGDYHLAHSARAELLPAAGPAGRGTRLVRTSAGARPAGAGTAVPRTAAR